MAAAKRAAFRHEEYWGKPVPGFGDPDARVVIVGLAPAAHGANRTGRMFTGDRSGDFLFASLHRLGIANRPVSKARDDGLHLKDVYILAAGRCAPPANKPLPEELDHCRSWFEEELALLPRVRVALTLGKIGHDALVRLLRARGEVEAKRKLEFTHGAVHRIGGSVGTIVCSFHVSQQNTFTGRLTAPMFDAVVSQALARAR